MPTPHRFIRSEEVRLRIRVAELITRLHEHVRGLVKMSATQVKAAEILLRKAVPDLKAVEHSGTLNVNYDAVVLELLKGAMEVQDEPGIAAGHIRSPEQTAH